MDKNKNFFLGAFLGAIAITVISSFFPKHEAEAIPRNKPITLEGCICVSPTMLPAGFLRGDVNLSGHLNITDATIIGNHIRQTLAMDYNSDGKIDEKDVKDLVNFIFSKEAALQNQLLDPRSSGTGR